MFIGLFVLQLSALQSETKDEELKQMSLYSLAFIAYSQVRLELLPLLLDTLDLVSHPTQPNPTQPSTWSATQPNPT